MIYTTGKITNDKKNPTLESQDLIIREVTMDDLETLNRVLNESTGSDTPLEMR